MLQAMVNEKVNYRCVVFSSSIKVQIMSETS